MISWTSPPVTLTVTPAINENIQLHCFAMLHREVISESQRNRNSSGSNSVLQQHQQR